MIGKIREEKVMNIIAKQHIVCWILTVQSVSTRQPPQYVISTIVVVPNYHELVRVGWWIIKDGGVVLGLFVAVKPEVTYDDHDLENEGDKSRRH